MDDWDDSDLNDFQKNARDRRNELLVDPTERIFDGWKHNFETMDDAEDALHCAHSYVNKKFGYDKAYKKRMYDWALEYMEWFDVPENIQKFILKLVDWNSLADMILNYLNNPNELQVRAIEYTRKKKEIEFQEILKKVNIIIR